MVLCEYEKEGVSSTFPFVRGWEELERLVALESSVAEVSVWSSLWLVGLWYWLEFDSWGLKERPGSVLWTRDASCGCGCTDYSKGTSIQYHTCLSLPEIHLVGAQVCYMPRFLLGGMVMCSSACLLTRSQNTARVHIKKLWWAPQSNSVPRITMTIGWMYVFQPMSGKMQGGYVCRNI